MKDKETIHEYKDCPNPDSCDIHIGNCFTDAFGGGSIMEKIKNPYGEKKCKVNPKHENVDKYGCLECFSEWCLIEMFKDEKV